MNFQFKVVEETLLFNPIWSRKSSNLRSIPNLHSVFSTGHSSVVRYNKEVDFSRQFRSFAHTTQRVIVFNDTVCLTHAVNFKRVKHTSLEWIKSIETNLQRSSDRLFVMLISPSDMVSYGLPIPKGNAVKSQNYVEKNIRRSCVVFSRFKAATIHFNSLKRIQSKHAASITILTLSECVTSYLQLINWWRFSVESRFSFSV